MREKAIAIISALTGMWDIELEDDALESAIKKVESILSRISFHTEAMKADVKMWIENYDPEGVLDENDIDYISSEMVDHGYIWQRVNETIQEKIQEAVEQKKGDEVNGTN